MPIKVKKKDIKIKDLTISGGWTATIPEVRMIPEDELAYVAFYTKQGISRKEAEKIVRKSVQDVFNVRWNMVLRVILSRAYRDYVKRWPELKGKGFDPEMISKLYVPGMNFRFEGRPFYDQMLVLMAERAER